MSKMSSIYIGSEKSYGPQNTGQSKHNDAKGPQMKMLRVYEGLRRSSLIIVLWFSVLRDQIFYRSFANWQHFRLQSFASLYLDCPKRKTSFLFTLKSLSNERQLFYFMGTLNDSAFQIFRIANQTVEEIETGRGLVRFQDAKLLGEKTLTHDSLRSSPAKFPPSMQRASSVTFED